MGWRDMPQKSQREAMPYMQIAPDTWVVIRESMEHPKAIIQLVTARDQTEKYFLLTWHLDPSRRRLHGMYDTLEEANQEVKWPRGPVEKAMATRQGPGFDGRPSSSQL